MRYLLNLVAGAWLAMAGLTASAAVTANTDEVSDAQDQINDAVAVVEKMKKTRTGADTGESPGCLDHSALRSSGCGGRRRGR